MPKTTSRIHVADTRTIAPLGNPLVLYVHREENVIGVTASPITRDEGRVRLYVLPRENGRPTAKACTALAASLAPLAEEMLDDWEIVLSRPSEAVDPDLGRLGTRATRAWKEICSRVESRYWEQDELTYTVDLEHDRLLELVDGAEDDVDEAKKELVRRAKKTVPGFGEYVLGSDLEGYIEDLFRSQDAAAEDRRFRDRPLVGITPEQAREILDLLIPYTNRNGVTEARHQRIVHTLTTGYPVSSQPCFDPRGAGLQIGERLGDSLSLNSRNGRWCSGRETVLERLSRLASQA